MTVIIGRGKTRKTFEVPCAMLLSSYPRDYQHKLHNALCLALGIINPEVMS